MENEKEFISLSEAAKLAKVSSMTNRRFAKKLQVSNNQDDAHSVRVLSDNNPFGKKYQIARDKVMSAFNVTEVNSVLNALRADFRNLQHNKDHHRRNIAMQACGV